MIAIGAHVQVRVGGSPPWVGKVTKAAPYPGTGGGWVYEVENQDKLDWVHGCYVTSVKPQETAGE